MNTFPLLFTLLGLLTAIGKPTPDTVPGTNLPKKTFPLPINAQHVSHRTLDEVAIGGEELNKWLGGYPPRFSSEMEREAIYLTWRELMLDATALTKDTTPSERSLNILADLYRQGHNMDVEKTGELAKQSVEECLQQFPQSVPCHFTAVHLYLSTEPKKLASKTEHSLNFLRAHFAPMRHPRVESAYIFLYVFEEKNKEALQLIDAFLTEFPDDREAIMVKKLQIGLKYGRKRVD